MQPQQSLLAHASLVCFFFIMCAVSPVLHIWAFICCCERFEYRVSVGKRAEFLRQDHLRCSLGYRTLFGIAGFARSRIKSGLIWYTWLVSELVT